MIGHGSFGKIYRGIYNAEKVVVKIFEDVDNEDICQEATFLNKLAHPNVVQFKGICLEEGGTMLKYMVFDLKPYGVNVEVHNLSDLIKHLSHPNCRGYKKLIWMLHKVPKMV